MKYIHKFNESVDSDDMAIDIKEVLQEYIDEYNIGYQDRGYPKNNGIYYYIRKDDENNINSGYTVDFYNVERWTDADKDDKSYHMPFERLRLDIVNIIQRLKKIGYRVDICQEWDKGITILVYDYKIDENLSYNNDTEDVKEVIDLFQEYIDEWGLNRMSLIESPWLKGWPEKDFNYNKDYVYTIYEIKDNELMYPKSAYTRPDRQYRGYNHIILLDIYLHYMTEPLYDSRYDKSVKEFINKLKTFGYNATLVLLSYGKIKLKITS